MHEALECGPACHHGGVTRERSVEIVVPRLRHAVDDQEPVTQRVLFGFFVSS